MNIGTTRDKGLHSIYLSMHLICDAGMFGQFCSFLYFLVIYLYRCDDVVLY